MTENGQYADDMNILLTTTSLAPEFGGTARYVPALALALARKGHQITLLSLDFGKAYSQVDKPSHPNLSCRVVRVRFKLGMRPVLLDNYRAVLLDIVEGQRDLIIHDNGIWLPYSGVLHRVARKRGLKMITTIHGMLEPWSMNYGKVRKQAAWALYQKRRLERNTLIHATSPDEANNLRSLGIRTPVVVLQNATEIPDQEEIGELEAGDKRILLFLSRIHPKKGLLNLVGAIDRLRPKDWKVVVGGYDEGGYLKVVSDAVKLAGLEDYFDFIGPLNDQEKWTWFKRADLFVLPSFSENFGMVVAESLAAGTPVITTQGTPWKDLVDYNCGWWIQPEKAALVESLKEALGMDRTQLDVMGHNGRDLVESKYTWPALATRFTHVYRWMLGKGPRPEEVRD